MNKHDLPRAVDAAITIVEVVDGCVVLIVRAQCHQFKLALRESEVGDGVRREVGFGGVGLPVAVGRSVAEVKPAGFITKNCGPRAVEEFDKLCQGILKRNGRFKTAKEVAHEYLRSANR